METNPSLLTHLFLISRKNLARFSQCVNWLAVTKRMAINDRIVCVVTLHWLRSRPDHHLSSPLWISVASLCFVNSSGSLLSAAEQLPSLHRVQGSGERANPGAFLLNEAVNHRALQFLGCLCLWVDLYSNFTFAWITARFGLMWSKRYSSRRNWHWEHSMFFFWWTHLTHPYSNS